MVASPATMQGGSAPIRPHLPTAPEAVFEGALMPSALTIPGVQVQTVFEPAPVLPGATGILGVVGVADAGPIDPTPVTQLTDFITQFGRASRYTMPEVRTALAGGVSTVYVARISPGKGTKATLRLFDDEAEPVVDLEARAEGAWGGGIAVRVIPVRTLSGQGVKYVNLEVSLNGTVVETLQNLVMDPEDPNDLFTQVNERSNLLVAFDPVFGKGLPSAMSRTALTDLGARKAAATLRSNSADVATVTAKRAGEAGNNISVHVADGQAALPLTGAGNAAAVTIVAKTTGTVGTGIRVTVQASGPDSVTLVITPATGSPRTVGPVSSVAALVTALANDPDVTTANPGSVLPSQVNSAPLTRRIDVQVLAQGRDPATYADIADLAGLAAISDPLVAFAAVDGATQLPDADLGVPLAAGRDRGPALDLTGNTADQPLLELVPAPGVTAALEVEVTRGTSTVDGFTAVAGLRVFADGELVETWPNLTMDPDDPGYLPEVLQGSSYLRSYDLFVRSRTTSLPAGLARPTPLTPGTSPIPDDYQEALDRLEGAEEVDLVIASVANQLTDDQVRTVHQQVVAHCAKMADLGRNRIGLGAVTAGESANVRAIIDHADDVRSDHFVLTAPAGTDAATAGLLGLLNYFESPTFKTVPAPGIAPGHYTDAELTQLIEGDVAVINERRHLGIIVVKGILTSGRQINVQRTANKAVRDVKATAETYIGLLNNDGDRNALKQQITALLLQMQRDGAIVPSTDGKDPAFTVDVYSTENDFALGIVRVDIAIRPVRAVDYIYATILVKN
jgi:hypothetical protein